MPIQLYASLVVHIVPSVVHMDGKFSDSMSHFSVTIQTLIMCSAAEFISVSIFDSLKLCIRFKKSQTRQQRSN